MSQQPNPDSPKQFEGRDICIFLGGAVAHSAVVVRCLHGHCDIETEKAIKLQLNKGYVWIPTSYSLIKDTYGYLKKL